MTKQTRWLAAALALAVAAAGWLGWREAAWRQAYCAEMTGQLIYQVEMAHRNLVRARETQAYQEKVEALATAHGYLVPAHVQADALLERIAPSKTGREAYMPKHYVVMLLQYARNLSPDLPDEALKRRIELLGGLEEALKAGRTERLVTPVLHYAVDVPALKQSLEAFFQPMLTGPESGFLPRFEDAPNRLLLIHPGAGVQVASDTGPQARMGAGEFPPFTLMDVDAALHQSLQNSLSVDWAHGSYHTVSIPEGLPQTLTLQLPEGAAPSLILHSPASGEKAVFIPNE